jgi:hypothetical protein
VLGMLSTQLLVSGMQSLVLGMCSTLLLGMQSLVLGMLSTQSLVSGMQSLVLGMLSTLTTSLVLGLRNTVSRVRQAHMVLCVSDV